MSTPVTFNGVIYPIPVQGDQKWAPPTTRYLVALASGTLQPTGGLFTLTSDVNFGPTFGLLSKYFISVNSLPATSGLLRLTKTDTIDWRNNANSGNNVLAVNGSDQLTFNGAALTTGLTSLADGAIWIGSSGNLPVARTLSGDITVTDLGVTAIGANKITNSQVNSSAAIAYSKLNLSGSIVNADINSSASIVYSKLSLTNSIVNADIASAAAIAYSKLTLTGSIVNADVNASAAIAISKLASSGSGSEVLRTTSAGAPYYAPDAINVLDYGAPTNGTSDATSAINAAITAAQAIGTGGTVILPRGLTFTVLGQLKPHGITLSGYGATIIRSGNLPLIKIVDSAPSQEMTTIEGITFQAADSTAGNTGVTIQIGASAGDPDNGLGNGAFQVTIRDNYFWYANGDSIYVKRGEALNVIDNLWFSIAVGHCIKTDGESSDALGELFTNALNIDHNHINRTNQTVITPAFLLDGIGVYFNSNSIVGCQGGGVLAGSQNISTGFSFNNNFCEQNGPYHFKVVNVVGFEMAANRMLGLGPANMVNAIYLDTCQAGSIHDSFILIAGYSGYGIDGTSSPVNINIARTFWNAAPSISPTILALTSTTFEQAGVLNVSALNSMGAVSEAHGNNFGYFDGTSNAVEITNNISAANVITNSSLSAAKVTLNAPNSASSVLIQTASAINTTPTTVATFASTGLTLATALAVGSGGTGKTALSSFVPTIQSFTSGSGTYTTPAGVTWIKVKMVGGGAGGGSGDSGGAGNNGGNTTFGTTLLVANGGTGGAAASAGGAGGSASLGSGPIGQALSGATGNAGTILSAQYGNGGGGAVSSFGGAGAETSDAAGGAAIANTGSGGAGGATDNAAGLHFSAGGGGAGGYVDAIITSPAGTYSYAVGAKGTGHTTPGAHGFNGGDGGSGVIIVEEHYI